MKCAFEGVVMVDPYLCNAYDLCKEPVYAVLLGVPPLL